MPPAPRPGTGPAPALSAHRGGSEVAPEGTYEAYQSALAAGAEYLEFDVRRSRDGILVACHPARIGRYAVADLSYPELCDLAGYQVPPTADLVRLIAAGRARAHIDVKDAACAGPVLEQALGLLPPDSVIVTTRDRATAAGIGRQYPGVHLGLTRGGDMAETASFALRRARQPGRGRLDDALAAGASWAVLHQRLARTGLLAECRRRGLGTMVWTVSSDRGLRYWLASPDVDVLVTDRPGRAARLRAVQADPAPPGGHSPSRSQ